MLCFDVIPSLFIYMYTLQRALFWADSPYIDTCLNFSTMATLLHLQGTVAIVERFICN